MSCVQSWLPGAVADTVLAHGCSAPSLLAWLGVLRRTVEEDDPLADRPMPPPSPEPEPEPASAFDDILSELGREIYKLDEYQRRISPSTPAAVTDSTLALFDSCLREMTADDGALTTEMDEPRERRSVDSDDTFVTPPGGPEEVFRRTSLDVNGIFDSGAGAPVPPARRRRTTLSSGSSPCDNLDRASPKRRSSRLESLGSQLESDSDSASTCWSYRVCSSDAENASARDEYATVWSHSTGYHNSDEILQRVLRENHASERRVSLHEAAELPPDGYPLYALPEEGGARARADMAPAAAQADGYEPVRVQENIYEEIEFGGSSSGSVEVLTCGSSASGASAEGPLYANLLDFEAYAVSGDVIAWKNTLLDPFCNEDEEDEWITPEESLMYSREQRPPYIIPRITHYRAYRTERKMQEDLLHSYPEESIQEQQLSIKESIRHFEGHQQDWSPMSERSRQDIERSFSKASSDSPPFVRINKKLGGSNENLLAIGNLRRGNNLHYLPSSSGDSLDVEVREREQSSRSRKSRSMMVAPRAPVPMPRMLPRLLDPEEVAIFEGAVKRTRFAENGKKMRKHWIDCYLVLTQTALVFYKDAKTYQAAKASKQAGTPPSPTGSSRAEYVLSLRNALVSRCTQQNTSRHTRSLVVTVGHDQILLQDESPAGATHWLELIIHTINRLPSDYVCPNNSTEFENLTRTPPSARGVVRPKNKVGDSSNEDLSDSTEPSNVKAKLRKFFTRRPTREALITKGIYQDEPMFGRNLEEVCGDRSPRVPEFVVRCVRQIEATDENLCTDGLYRASGNLSQVQKIRLEIDQNNMSVVENNPDIHVLTGSLKLFFRELKEPLIPCKLFDRILAATLKKPKEARTKEFREIVNALPPCNKDTLKFLLEHLLKVTEHKEKNRMHTANLAIVFGPTLLWAPAELAHNIAIDCIQQNHAIEILLTDFNQIFVDDKSKKKA